MINKTIKSFSPFEWVMVLGMTAITAYFAITGLQMGDDLLYTFLSSLAGITGVVCVVLVAKGKISNYIWGIVNILAYAAIAMQARYFGEVMLNMLYYLPMQFIGIYFWKNKINTETNEVESKVMTLQQIIIGTIGILATVYLYNLLLIWLGGNQPLLDSMSTVMSVIAMILMVFRYAEQWLIWIFVNIVSIILWLINGDMIMVAMWSIYLINACYGWLKWKKRA